jgi:hypothetical protein
LSRLIKIEMETRLKVDEMERIKIKCDFSSYLSVACMGSGRDKAGGISLLWQDQASLSVINFSSNHILCSIVEVEMGDNRFMSCMYGFPEEHNKRKTWDLIQQISSQVGNKWLCLGDLNDILSLEEKVGGTVRSQTQIGIGRRMVEACGLQDMGFDGYPYTWTTGRQESENIHCRLDRALAT